MNNSEDRVLSLFGTSISDMTNKKNDFAVIDYFNKAVKNGIDSSTALDEALEKNNKSINEISSAALDLMKNSNNGAISLTQYANRAKKLGVTSKVASVGVKLLGSALNMLASYAITSLISYGIQWIDDQVHALERLEEKLADAKSEYQENTQEVSNLESELSSVNKQIEDIRAKGKLEITDQEQLDLLERQRISLETQLAVAKEIADVSAGRMADAGQAALQRSHFENSISIRDGSDEALKRAYQSDKNRFANEIFDDIPDPLVRNDEMARQSYLLDYEHTLDAYILSYRIAKDQYVLEAGKYQIAQDKFNKALESGDKDAQALAKATMDSANVAMQNWLNDMGVVRTILADEYSYLDNALAGFSRFTGENLSASEEYINSQFDLLDSLGLYVLESSGKSHWDEALSVVKTQYADSIADLEKWIIDHGSIDSLAIAHFAPGLMQDLMQYGFSEDEISKYLAQSFGVKAGGTVEPLKEGYDAITASIEKTQPVVEALTAALEEQASAGSITAETYKKLIAQDANFANFLEKTASGYMLNTDAAYDYLEAQNQFAKGKAIGRIMELQEALANPDLTDDAINAYRSEITQLELLVTELDSATDAYARLTNARDTANQDAGYQNVKSGYDQFAADRKRGKTNTDDFQAQVDYLLGEDWRSRVGAEGGYKNEEAAYKAAEKLYKRYYNYKEENELAGGLKFIEDLMKTDLYDKENDQIVASTIEEIAAVMQTSTANVRNLLGLLDTYGMAPELTFSIDESDEALAAKAAEIEKAQQKITEIYAEIDRLEQEMNTLRENGDEASAADRQHRIDQLEVELQTYEAVASSVAAGADANSPLKQTLTDLNTVSDVIKTLEESGINIDVVLGGDWEDLKTYLQIDNAWRGLNGSGKSKQASKSAYRKREPDISFADDVIEDPVVVPVELNEESLANEIKEVTQDINDDPLVFQATIESTDGETVSFDIDQTTVDLFTELSQRVSKIAEFHGVDTTNMQNSATELNNAWINLQSIEDTSSAEFQAASDRFGTAITNFIAAKDALEVAVGMKPIIDVRANVSPAQQAINSIKGKTVYVTVKTIGEANAKGTKKAQGGSSIVDEEGAELILHKNQGTYELGTNQGARMTQLEPGDEVIPASETKKILRRAAKTGGAFATGTSAWNNISQLLASGNKAIGSSSSSKKTKKLSSSSYKKYIEKLFDWVEIRLEVLQRATEGWVQSASDAVGYIAKNASLDKALVNITKQMNDSAKAYSQYMAQADTIAKKAGLSADIIRKVQEGSIEIASYDDKTQDKIKNYQEWYNKALDVKDAIVDLREQEKELAVERLDNVINHYQQRIDRIDSKLDYNAALIDLKGSTNIEITEQDYLKSIDYTKQKISELKAEQAALSKELANMVKSGYIAEGSEQWHEYQSELDDLGTSILEAQLSLRELATERLDSVINHYQQRIEQIEADIDFNSALVDLKGAMGVQITAQDYAKSIDSTKQKISELRAEYAALNNELSAMMQAGYITEGSEQWHEYQSELNDLNTVILESQKDLQDLIDLTNNIALTNLQYAMSALERSASELSHLMDLHEAQGRDHSASDYESLIKNGMSQIDNLKAQNDELRRQQEGLDVTSEKWQELQEQIDSNNDSINNMMISQEQWNDSVLDLKISEIEKYRDALEKTNDQYERQRALQQAIEDLERAKSQRNKKIYREGVGFVWEEDRDAIQNAQEKIDQLIHQETMNKLDELIEAVENQKIDSNVYSANGTLLGKEYSLPSFVGYAELMNSLGGTNIVSSAMEQAKKAAYQQTMGNVVSSAPATTLTIGDINVHGVDSPDALAEALLAEFPNAMLQAMYGKL